MNPLRNGQKYRRKKMLLSRMQRRRQLHLQSKIFRQLKIFSPRSQRTHLKLTVVNEIGGGEEVVFEAMTCGIGAGDIVAVDVGAVTAVDIKVGLVGEVIGVAVSVGAGGGAGVVSEDADVDEGIAEADTHQRDFTPPRSILR